MNQMPKDVSARPTAGGCRQMYSRNILDVALPSRGGPMNQFTLTLRSTRPEDLDNDRYLLRAVVRTQEFLETVVKPEAKLRRKWEMEDALDVARGAWPPLLIGSRIP